MVFVTGLNVAGPPIGAGKANAGVDWDFTVLTLPERQGQSKIKGMNN